MILNAMASAHRQAQRATDTGSENPNPALSAAHNAMAETLLEWASINLEETVEAVANATAGDSQSTATATATTGAGGDPEIDPNLTCLPYPGPGNGGRYYNNSNGRWGASC